LVSLHLALWISLLIPVFGMNEEPASDSAGPDELPVTLTVRLNRNVYQESNFGEPPQIAVWVEKEDAMRTVWVSRRTATGYWEGKVECPTSLPIWVSRYVRRTGNPAPGVLNPLPDALTGATPVRNLTIRTRLPRGSSWTLFLELNISGDYNASFPPRLEGGLPDPDGNGQPSLIYAVPFRVVPDFRAEPVLTGRSDQLDPVSRPIPDLSGITSARHILKSCVLTVGSSR